VTTDERCLRAAAFLRAELGLAGLGFEQAIAFTDKAVMKRQLGNHGVPVASCEVVHDLDGVEAAAERVTWPVVVKPRTGFSAINTFVIRDKDHLAALRTTGVFDRPPQAGALHPALSATDGLGALSESPRGFLVENYVDVAAEYHCEYLTFAGEEVYCLPFRYPDPLLRTDLETIGSVHLSLTSTEAHEVQALTRAAAHALGLENGFAHAEVFRLADGRWLLGEIGARPGGAQVPKIMAHQYGLDVNRLMGDVALGKRPNVVIDEGGRSVAWVSIPAPLGRVISVTPPQELRALPGVIDVVMELAVGDEATGHFGSLLYAGHVFCAGPSTDEALKLAVRAATHCKIKTLSMGVNANA